MRNSCVEDGGEEEMVLLVRELPDQHILIGRKEPRGIKHLVPLSLQGCPLHIWPACT